LNKAAAHPASELTCMAEIVGVHGIRGFVKIKVFAENPAKLADGPPLCDSTGEKTYPFLSFQQHGNIFLAQVEGVNDRNAAEKLRGTKLYAPRAALPPLTKKDSYYHTDLVGMTAYTAAREAVGRVIAVANFGAGDLLEIKPPKGNSFYLPFTGKVVPHVDVAKKEMTVDIPHGLLD